MNYDKIATTYHQRYAINPMDEVGWALSRLAGRLPRARILEVGCGTGRWLAELGKLGSQVFGLDYSLGMLRQAQAQGIDKLLHADAARLPFSPAAFGLVYCVNAFHHFIDRLSFLMEARRLLIPGGALAILGMDPHAPGNHMYIYDYFEGVWETDLRRFATQETIKDWMSQAGFSSTHSEPVYHIRDAYTGDDVWKDPFLEKNSTSQLVLLSDEAYQAGLERMRVAIHQAGEAGKSVHFESNVTIYMVSGIAAG